MYVLVGLFIHSSLTNLLLKVTMGESYPFKFTDMLFVFAICYKFILISVYKYSLLIVGWNFGAFFHPIAFLAMV